MLKRICILNLSFILLFAALASADITGKVVSVADGDTITVLQNRTQYKIRLYGIDCPESHQDFGNRAKQLTSKLVFGKHVKVVKKDMDRYGRVVGIVYVNGLCVNKELISKGLAWVYRQYCKNSFCNDWLRLEKEARKNSIGLWSHPNPVPPWEFRRGPQRSEANVYHGNTRSMVFHHPSCEHFNCKNCSSVFRSKEKALRAGYRPCGRCKP
jgi:endonuclease YncB( thermonuclease family)